MIESFDTPKATAMKEQDVRHYFQDKAVRLPKKERTRSVLIDGAISAVALHGIQGASIKEIATLAGVSNGTYYNYFKSRDDVLRLAANAVAKEITDEIADQVEGIPNGLGRLIVSTKLFIDRSTMAADWGSLIVDVVHQLADTRINIAEHLQADVALAIAQGDIADMPNDFAIHQIACLIALAIEMIIKGKDDPAIDIAGQTCVSVLQVLGMSAGDAAKAVKKYL